MKLFLTLATILAIAAGVLHANSTRSASFYLNAPQKYEGKKITLYVAFVKREADSQYSAYTVSRDGDETAYIDVLLSKDKTESFARKYGSDFKYQNGKIRTRPMSGILSQVEGRWFLAYGVE